VHYGAIFTVPESFHNAPDSSPLADVGRSVKVIFVALSSPGVLSCSINISSARSKSCIYVTEYSLVGSGNLGAGVVLSAISVYHLV